MAQAQSFRSTSTQQLLRPLQQTADRVSRQVEEFAKCVDRFSTSLNPAEQEMWENARHLAQKYSTIAVSRQKQASSELTASRSANRSRRGLQAEIEKAGEEIEQSQFEAELWSLLAGLIACDSPRTSSEVDEYQKKALQDLHQYSTADDVWEAFLLSDRFAQQYQEVLAWLQKTAASAKLSINEVTASLRHQAQQGDGIFSAAWLFTKHSIKGQKQSRSWPKPLELDNPGIEISHTRSSDSKPLVTQLDPDTRSRQKQCLEPQDEFHEQASWLACWEMLRRGYNADHFRAHWSEAKEFWRAASTGEVKSASGMDKSSSWTRFASLVSRSEWGKRCYALCRDGTDMDRYQRAVYGLLCGDPHSPIRVCKSVDDILFVCFNTLLIQRYRQFVQAYQSRLDKQDSIAYDSPPSERKQVQECLKYCENVDVIKVERQKPQKMIEAALVSTEYESFLLRQGSALALDAEADGRASSLIAVDPNPPRNESIQAAAQDPDTLRFVAHLQLLLRSLGYLEEAYEHDPEILDNNLAGYIRWLQQEGKMAMIPLYASKLLPDRAARAMGSVLIDVTDPVERDLQVKLMRQYNIDVTNALRMLYHIANADILETWASGSAKYAPVRISEYPAGGEGMVVKVRSGLMGDEIAEAEEVAVRTMEWFRYANRDIWTTTCEAASTFYEIFISRGCLAVARQLAERASLAKLSTSILDVDLSRGDAASAGGDVDMDDVLSVHHAQTINPSRRHRERRRGPSALDGAPKFRQKALFDATATWRQLEQLTNALDSLEKWSELADEVERWVHILCCEGLTDLSVGTKAKAVLPKFGA